MTENLFRNDFKYYKQRVPAPSLDAVIDSRNPAHLAEHFREIHVENKDGDIPKNINLKGKWRMFASKPNPGKGSKNKKKICFNYLNKVIISFCLSVCLFVRS